jgi:hypothetical protein
MTEEKKDELLVKVKRLARKVKQDMLVYGLVVGIGMSGVACDYSVTYNIVNPPAQEETEKEETPEPTPEPTPDTVENAEINRIIDRILANSSSYVDDIDVEALRAPLSVLGSTKEGQEVLKNTPNTMGIQIQPAYMILSSRKVEYSSDRNIHTTKISSLLLHSDYIHQAPLLLAETFVKAAERQYIFDRFPTVESSLTEQGKKNMELLTQAAVSTMDYQLAGELIKYDPAVYSYGTFDYEYNIKADDVWNWNADVNLKMDIYTQGQPNLTQDDSASLYSVAVSDKKAEYYRQFLSENGYEAGCYADWLTDYQVSGQTQKLLNALSYHVQYKNQRLLINELFNDTKTEGIRPFYEKENGYSGTVNDDNEYTFVYSPETGIVTLRSFAKQRE